MESWELSLERLVRERGTALIRYGYLLCGDRAEAEDLVQDALVRTYARGRRVREETVEAYVRSAMLSTHVDGFRRRRRWAAVRHLLGDDGHTPGPAVATTEPVAQDGGRR